jgi:LysM repeat protein
MKFKILLLTITLFTLSASAFSKPLIDSVGVKNNDGKKVVLFKVKAKDTYYSIGHRYNIKPEVLMKYNGAKKQTLSIGAIVNVPTDLPYKKSAKEKSKISEEVADAPKKETKKEKKARLAREEQEAEEEAKAAKKHKRKAQEEQTEESTTPVVVQMPQQAPERIADKPQPQAPVQQQTAAPVNNAPTMQYKVSAGETLYAISKRFNMNVDDLTKLNNLTSTTLSPGQILNVRSTPSAPEPQQPVQQQVQQVQQAITSNPTVKRDSGLLNPLKDSSNSDHRLNANKYGLYEKNEKGVATWIDDTSLDPNKKLVLHRTAPIGTVIKITNPMTNRTTFAKVVGRFTDNESTKDVIIVMTKNVADSLGALDKRFHVTISYGSPNE